MQQVVKADAPWRQVAGGVEIALRVQPRASRDEVVGVTGGFLKVRLKASPVDGAANRACLRLLADRLQLKPASLILVAGERARTKRVLAVGLDPAEVARRLGI